MILRCGRVMILNCEMSLHFTWLQELINIKNLKKTLNLQYTDASSKYKTVFNCIQCLKTCLSLSLGDRFFIRLAERPIPSWLLELTEGIKQVLTPDFLVFKIILSSIGSQLYFETSHSIIAALFKEIQPICLFAFV